MGGRRGEDVTCGLWPALPWWVYKMAPPPPLAGPFLARAESSTSAWRRLSLVASGGTLGLELLIGVASVPAVVARTPPSDRGGVPLM